jgi:hypothetical protein
MDEDNMQLIAYSILEENVKKISASAGNRTRVARVAGEHSTTEPLMLR